jgi:hypothetical protein
MLEPLARAVGASAPALAALEPLAALARAVGASAPALVLVVYASVYVLAAVVPVFRLTRGYVVSHVTHDVQMYRLNGLYVLAIVLATSVAAVRAGVVRADVFAADYARAAGAAAAWTAGRGAPRPTRSRPRRAGGRPGPPPRPRPPSLTRAAP